MLIYLRQEVVDGFYQHMHDKNIITQHTYECLTSQLNLFAARLFEHLQVENVDVI